MANNRFNKQVSPKGYAKGGKVKKGKSSPGPKAGRPASPRKGLGPAGGSKKTNRDIIIDLDLSKPENERKIKIKKFSK